MLGLRATLGRHAQPTGRLIARLKPMGMEIAEACDSAFLASQGNYACPLSSLGLQNNQRKLPYAWNWLRPLQKC